ncbi:MAG: hypothetical protein HN640_03295 [Gammaproteobacteria bacterium]|jgi:hypothetical protein|nr:hypothetical protein [Gammaproteobacteria bacterium]
MAGFLGSIAGIMVDPLLFIICIFIVSKVSSLFKAIIYAGIFQGVFIALLAYDLHAMLVIKHVLAGIIEVSIVYAIFQINFINKFFTKKNINEN